MWYMMNAKHYASTRFFATIGLFGAVVVALLVGSTSFSQRSYYGTITSVQTVAAGHGQPVDNVTFRTNKETLKLENSIGVFSGRMERLDFPLPSKRCYKITVIGLGWVGRRQIIQIHPA